MSDTGKGRIFLHAPRVSEYDRAMVREALDSGYIAPCGPFVDEFERDLAICHGANHAVAVSSGTAAMDLAMAELGVDESWTVVAPTLTFIATVGPAWHRGAKLVFVDSCETGLMDLELLESTLRKIPAGKRSKALVIGVDLYGKCLDRAVLIAICQAFGVKLVMDSAEAVGSTAGKCGLGTGVGMTVLSFNGNKIISSSGGGALLAQDADVAERARRRSQQSRENVPWYEHREVGYNYRMSNIVAALGCAQLRMLPSTLKKHGELAKWYRSRGVNLLPEAKGENHWLNVAVCPGMNNRDRLMARFAAANIETRPVWKPMHLQPVFAKCKCVGGRVAERLFRCGICLPGGLCVGNGERRRIAAVIRDWEWTK